MELQTSMASISIIQCPARGAHFTKNCAFWILYFIGAWVKMLQQRSYFSTEPLFPIPAQNFAVGRIPTCTFLKRSPILRPITLPYDK